MRLLILGAGATGGYFGARLAAAGVDVTFLVRPQRAALLARNGLVVRSPLGDVSMPVATITCAKAGFDAVMLSCKAFDLGSALDAIAPAMSGDTQLLPLLNGMRHLDLLDQRFGREHVLGGLCHIGVTLTDAGEIQHLGKLQDFILGARVPAQSGFSEALQSTLARGGFAPQLSSNIVLEMWEKFVLLTTYAGMTCLMRAPIGAIVAAQDGAALIDEMLLECAAVASRCGYAPRETFIAKTRAQLTTPGSRGTASMLRDIQRGARTEHDHILGDMLARAVAAGLQTPLLRTAYAHLQAYAATRVQD